MVTKSIIGAACACLTVVSFNANAVVLEERLGGLAYYDAVADLTWLADANAGAGSAFDNGALSTDGAMTWDNANAWAASLDIAGVTGWRLADIDPTCLGYNCTSSEMSNLFYNVLGGSAGSSIVTIHNPLTYDLFSNVQSYSYWSGMEWGTSPSTDDIAWGFRFDTGIRQANIKNNNLFAWAVHSGDVGEVPVPAAVWLFGSGFVGLIGFARRKA